VFRKRRRHLVTPLQEEATSGLIELMELYDPSTKFFLNTWTWGYEDVLKAVARRFNAKVSRLSTWWQATQVVQIHVDRYKAAIYRCGEDPFLKSIITTGIDTQFHACERFNRCSTIKDCQETVYINPTEMSTTNWELYKSETIEQLRSGERVTNLVRTILSVFIKLTTDSDRPSFKAFWIGGTTSPGVSIPTQKTSSELSPS
jgi:DNA cross-link repair 1C protein